MPTLDPRGVILAVLLLAGLATTGCDGATEGTPCSADSECEGTLICRNGTCTDLDSGACMLPEDCPLGQACVDGACTEAACDDATNPCAIGQSCTDGACVDGDEAVVIEDLGTLRVDGGASSELIVDLPDGARSMAIVLDGAASSLVLASTVRQPDNTLIFDWNNDLATNRTDATDGLYTLLVPTTPDVDVTGGRWRMSFLTDGSPFDARVTAVVKTAAATRDTLDLNLYFVGVDGLDAATAQTHPDFASLVENVGQTFSSAGISLGDVSYQDVTGADADKFRVIDSTENIDDELYQLFQLSAGQTNRAVNLFFVADITGSSDFSLLGLAGGIPGPPAIHGTSRSGVAVNMADWIAAGDDTASLAAARQLAELVIAHETGHFLGLYHTTERNGQDLGDGIHGQDPLDDTPVCPDSADANGNGILSAEECVGQGGSNLMFWSPQPNARELTASQAEIIRRNPLVQ